MGLALTAGWHISCAAWQAMLPAEERSKGIDRINGFSDGVFAFAVTVLVLQLQVPDVPPASSAPVLAMAIFNEWPLYVAYLISFVTLLITWVNHHRTFSIIVRADTPFMFLNGLLLLQISLIPYTTQLLQVYLFEPGGYIVAALYSGSLWGLGIFFTLLWLYASRKRQLLSKAISEHEVRKLTPPILLGPILYAVATGFAFIDVALTIAIDAALALFFLVFALRYPSRWI